MKCILGIDVGGTKIRAVALENLARPKIVWEAKILTPKNKRSFEGALKKIIETCQRKMKAARITHVGLGLPGVVDVENSRLVGAANLPRLNGWSAVNFFKKMNLPARLDNDGNCFLIAEAAAGNIRQKNIVAVVIGTGIGGALMIDGKLIRGAQGSAGEVGYMVIALDRKNGSWEALGALKAFKREGDRSRIIGIGVANLINILDPDVVIIGGGAVTSSSFKLSVVKQEVKRLAISPFAKQTPILIAKLGEQAQAIGAALLWR